MFVLDPILMSPPPLINILYSTDTYSTAEIKSSQSALYGWLWLWPFFFLYSIHLEAKIDNDQCLFTVSGTITRKCRAIHHIKAAKRVIYVLPYSFTPP